MVQLRTSSDEGLEPEAAECSCVVGDQRDRGDLTGLGIGEVIDQPDVAGYGVGFGQGEFDPGEGVARDACSPSRRPRPSVRSRDRASHRGPSRAAWNQP